MNTPSRSTLLRILRSYQDRGVDHLIENEKVALWIDMGLGKTAIILHALLELLRRSVNPVKGKVLLVGPIRVIETVWMQEAREWAATRSLRFSLLRGTPSQRAKAAQVDADIYLCNPELLLEALGSRKDFEVLVIDESTLFKNPSSKRFKQLRKHLKRFSRVIEATGTPAPNSLMDLWSQIFILDRGERLDTSFNRFKQTYFYPSDYQGYKWKPHDWAEETILEEVADLVFRVSHEEAGLDLKEPINNMVSITLPDRARRLYEEMEKKAFIQIRKAEVTASMAVTKMAKLRQLASGFVYDDERKAQLVHSEKLKATREIVEGSGSPVIVVYQFTAELQELQKEFPEGVVFGRPGPGWKKKGNLAALHRDAWNAGKIPILFLHPLSGGHGLNMQFGGNVMVIYSGSFSLEQMDQVRKRLDRPGQTEAVIYHWLVAEGTVDNLLMEVLHGRAKGQKRILELIKEYADGKDRSEHNSGGAGRGRKVHPGKSSEDAPSGYGARTYRGASKKPGGPGRRVIPGRVR